MDKDEIIATLAAAGLDIVEEDRNGNDTGWRLRSTCGAIVNLYDSGKIDIQGKNRDPVKVALALADQSRVTPGVKSKFLPARRVFVVYGHDGAAKTELEAMLRRWGLEPLIFDQIKSGGQTIIEKLETVRDRPTLPSF